MGKIGTETRTENVLNKKNKDLLDYFHCSTCANNIKEDVNEHTKDICDGCRRAKNWSISEECAKTISNYIISVNDIKHRLQCTVCEIASKSLLTLTKFEIDSGFETIIVTLEDNKDEILTLGFIFSPKNTCWIINELEVLWEFRCTNNKFHTFAIYMMTSKKIHSLARECINFLKQQIV